MKWEKKEGIKKFCCLARFGEEMSTIKRTSIQISGTSICESFLFGASHAVVYTSQPEGRKFSQDGELIYARWANLPSGVNVEENWQKANWTLFTSQFLSSLSRFLCVEFETIFCTSIWIVKAQRVRERRLKSAYKSTKMIQKKYKKAA